MTSGSDPPATSNGDAQSPKSVRSQRPNEGDDVDDFGLPRRPLSRQTPSRTQDSSDDEDGATFHDAEDNAESATDKPAQQSNTVQAPTMTDQRTDETTNLGDQSSARSKPAVKGNTSPSRSAKDRSKDSEDRGHLAETDRAPEPPRERAKPPAPPEVSNATPPAPLTDVPPSPTTSRSSREPSSPTATRAFPSIKKEKRNSGAAVSQWSHQKLVARDEESEEEEVEWQAMPALGEMDYYDDRGRLVAKATKEEIPDKSGYQAMNMSSKGYTKVQLDEDAQSATSLDEHTDFLFKKDDKLKDIDADIDEDEDSDDELGRDAAAQLESTKDLLTEGQRIAYVGVVRLTIFKMCKALEDVEKTKNTKKDLIKALENMDIWGQQIMVRLFSHMEIDSAEQVMIEQLAEHGVTPADLIPALMHNAKIKNPNANRKSGDRESEEQLPAYLNSLTTRDALQDLQDVKEGEEVPEVQAELLQTESLEVDMRWTVLCDLFLVLISDGNYDSRSRRLLERVATSMEVTWQQICRFEKRIVDALEMQEAELRETLDESDNLDNRRKAALKRKYITMGLVTVGGAAVIGLSAGLLAPLIGAGLAAGFSTIGIGGTTAFLTGVGGAAIVTSIGVTTGGTIALRATDRRMGHVKTFEYRPLHNNKRLNLILTVSGWMTGKVDDVRLPFSTVDPVMGDIYSLLWEPDMLRSTGDTINILATEALTQTIQQVLASTLLMGLMAAIQLPIILTKLAYLIDNPWNVSLDRANAAGLILADSLIQRHLGTRPITLVGFSLGARLIFSCLKELSNRGAYGIVQNVYLFGAPITAKRDEYLRARSVIAGRFVNGYAGNDWILGYLFRATAGGLGRVAGLAAVEDIPGLENKDVSAFVNGHMAYRAAMPRLLREVGWEVESDEFTEIEDPDPENHEARQRELIREIDEARKKAEQDNGKGTGNKVLGLFKRGKPAEKKDWEMYKAGAKSPPLPNASGVATPKEGEEPSVLFDIDAIRRELASEYIEVRELDSTMPTMQIVTTSKNGEKQTEYLRLPPDVNLSAEEMARMKLPPRPEDDVHEVTIVPAKSAKRSSWRSSPRQSPIPSPVPSRTSSAQPSPRRVPSPKQEDFAWEQPRELVSTLPPLTLTPNPSQHSFEPTPNASRPPLKAHATEPPPSQIDKGQGGVFSNPTSPVDAYTLEHNAWADDQDFGREREIKMTFE